METKSSEVEASPAASPALKPAETPTNDEEDEMNDDVLTAGNTPAPSGRNTPTFKEEDDDDEPIRASAAAAARIFDQQTKESQSIRDGTHKGFIAQVKLLEKEQKEKIKAIKRKRKKMLQSVEQIYDAEKKQTIEEYLEAVETTRDKMLEQVSLQRRKNALSALERNGMCTRRKTARVEKVSKTCSTFAGVEATFVLDASAIEMDLQKLRQLDSQLPPANGGSYPRIKVVPVSTYQSTHSASLNPNSTPHYAHNYTTDRRFLS